LSVAGTKSEYHSYNGRDDGAAFRKTPLLDCMIAAVALRSEASFATANAADFRPFESEGLKLLP